MGKVWDGARKIIITNNKQTAVQLTAQRDNLTRDTNRGVLSQPDIQWINVPLSPEIAQQNDYIIHFQQTISNQNY